MVNDRCPQYCKRKVSALLIARFLSRELRQKVWRGLTVEAAEELNQFLSQSQLSLQAAEI